MIEPNTIISKADYNSVLFAEWGSNFDFDQKEFGEITRFYQNPRSSARTISSIAAAIVLSSQANAVPLTATGHQSHSRQITADAVKLNAPQTPRIIVDSSPVGVLEKVKLETSDKELETIFKGLAKIWKDSTGGLSVTSRRFQHPTYKAILRLGPEIVPLILKELQEKPDWWFEALEYLTKENPASSTNSFEDAAKAWLAWEKSQPWSDS